MTLPNVPGTYTPRVEQQRNNQLERALRLKIGKYGEQTIEGTLNVTGTFQLDGEDIAQSAAQADSTAATVSDLKDDFNALLAKLRTAGLLAT